MVVGRCPVGGLEGGYDPFVSPQLEDPYPVWEAAREGRPVFRSEVRGAWVVTRYDDVVGDAAGSDDVRAERGAEDVRAGVPGG